MIHNPEKKPVFGYEVVVILRSEVVREEILYRRNPSTHRRLDGCWLPDERNVRLVREVDRDALLERSVEATNRTD